MSLRNTSKALEPFKDQNRSHVAVWEWIQRFGSSHIYNKHRRVCAFIIDETIIQLVVNISGCGSVLNPFTDLYLGSTFQRRETCLLLKNSLDLLYQGMEDM
ncbi:MAG TPA: hypothetical protein VK250_10305 [Nitrososphaeraceae archaeon]|nr:hypothetical protein [Nitrososphaeraceae archaeon]